MNAMGGRNRRGIFDRRIPPLGGAESDGAVKRAQESVRAQTYSMLDAGGPAGPEPTVYVRTGLWPHLLFRSDAMSRHPAVDWGERNAEASLVHAEVSDARARPLVYVAWSRAKRCLKPDPRSGVAVSAPFWTDHTGEHLLSDLVRFDAMRDGDLVLTVHEAAGPERGRMIGVAEYRACRPREDFMRPGLLPHDGQEFTNLAYRDLPADLAWLAAQRPDIEPPAPRRPLAQDRPLAR